MIAMRIASNSEWSRNTRECVDSGGAIFVISFLGKEFSYLINYLECFQIFLIFRLCATIKLLLNIMYKKPYL